MGQSPALAAHPQIVISARNRIDQVVIDSVIRHLTALLIAEPP
jgi:hypothetical protein